MRVIACTFITLSLSLSLFVLDVHIPINRYDLSYKIVDETLKIVLLQDYDSAVGYEKIFGEDDSKLLSDGMLKRLNKYI